jgi:hypothetical protein
MVNIQAGFFFFWMRWDHRFVASAASAAWPFEPQIMTQAMGQFQIAQIATVKVVSHL